eukprot:9232155-Pyramimonas_sp.AAC.1
MTPASWNAHSGSIVLANGGERSMYRGADIPTNVGERQHRRVEGSQDVLYYSINRLCVEENPPGFGVLHDVCCPSVIQLKSVEEDR